MRGRNAMRTAGEILRREGPKRLLVRSATVLEGVVYRYVVLTALDLRRELPDVTCDLPLEMRLLRAEDAVAYARFRAIRDPGRVARRLGRLGAGEFCVGAWLGEEIVSAAWYAVGTVELEEIGQRLRLAENEIYSYDSYTSERLRGLHIATVRGIWASRYVRSAGYRWTVGFVSPQNLPAHGPPRRIGSTILGRAGYLRLGPWRRDFVQPSGCSRRWTRPGTPIVLGRDFPAVLRTS